MLLKMLFTEQRVNIVYKPKILNRGNNLLKIYFREYF